ncbi:transcriptional regulator [Xanthomonas oryzae pv. oryzae PXO99A]|uniref:Transcriptional regulator n=1 Tax=Xanthomonas oryzae pv. oryzae (strain PXO99A) TaxID=360094 RepID=A0A0K0GFE0_XANOP|nr:transcriptional regulator [Xanthomonas oryzae pv. oryzae PXO99A]UWZ67420.1 transcriptional regulator [Xanthomonas oryzae pv. oryzae]
MQTCALGGLEGALARHAGHTFRALPGDAQAALGEVLALLSVIHPDSDAVTARRALWSALPANSAARVLVEAFVHAHLFVGGPGVAVAHEALLRQWPRAAEWIHENRRLRQARKRLQQASQRWATEGRRTDHHLLNSGRPLSEARACGSTVCNINNTVKPTSTLQRQAPWGEASGRNDSATAAMVNAPARRRGCHRLQKEEFIRRC